MHFIDSHCHLDFSAFDSDRVDMLARAREVGVATFVNPGCDLKTSKKALELARAEQDVFSAVGLHPSEAADFSPELILQFKEMAADPKVVAVGECGLDFFKYGDNAEIRAQQEIAFRAQLDLAAELDLPVIVHSRAAEAESVGILKEYPNLRGVLHCYTGDPAPAVAAAELGWYVGFTGIVTFKNAKNVHEAVKDVPLENMLIETDAPFLAPEPHRGERAEPAYVVEVAKKIAELKGVPVEEVAAITTANAMGLFHLPVQAAYNFA